MANVCYFVSAAAIRIAKLKPTCTLMLLQTVAISDFDITFCEWSINILLCAFNLSKPFRFVMVFFHLFFVWIRVQFTVDFFRVWNNLFHCLRFTWMQLLEPIKILHYIFSFLSLVFHLTSLIWIYFIRCNAEYSANIFHLWLLKEVNFMSLCYSLKLMCLIV